MDRMFIRDLSLRCIVGVKPEERVTRQEVLIGISMECDLSVAGRTDRLEDTVNFRRLEEQVVSLVEGSRFQLIERLGEAIAELCLADPHVSAATVTVDKPRALRFARSAAVEIRRLRLT